MPAKLNLIQYFFIISGRLNFGGYACTIFNLFLTFFDGIFDIWSQQEVNVTGNSIAYETYAVNLRL